MTTVESTSSSLDRSFQRLLLRLVPLARESSRSSLIEAFCEGIREEFSLTGVHFWARGNAEDWILVQACGGMKERFLGVTLSAAIDSILARACSSGTTSFSDATGGDDYPLAEQFSNPALMALPLPSAIGCESVLVLLQNEQAHFFGEDLIEKAKIVASQLAIALERAELQADAQAKAHELQQLLSISGELSSVANLDSFLRHFVCKASEFLGFGRAFVGLLEHEKFHVRWTYARGESAVADVVLPGGTASRALRAGEIFWTDRAEDVPGMDLRILKEFQVQQVIVVPLIGADGQVLGMFGVLDRAGGVPISSEDVRRAQALGAQVATALESVRNLHKSEQHRRRTESLVRLASEFKTLLRLPEFATAFTSRAAEMLGAGRAVLALRTSSDGLEIATALEDGKPTSPAGAILRRLGEALPRVLSERGEPVILASAEKLFGPFLARELGWEDCALVRLLPPAGEVSGVLCLAQCDRRLNHEDQQLLQAIAGHASVALENARLFTRMEQSNRHWTEIFDSITDFIVAHDEADHVLRVNRSLADSIGLAPGDLVGVSMWALLATGEGSALHSCPFCLITGRGMDEYVHPMLDRTYLVSTSRIHGANGEGLQTVHVLKDITDRREVERRYGELFDNIQEGLFFSTPDGRFVEVNDALVRMLGYISRNELLQADQQSKVYGSAEKHHELIAQLRTTGYLRNHEQTLHRRDGSVVHVLINAFAVRDAQGRVMQYRGLMLDISGLKNFQSELQRERDFSGNILNNTQSLILVADASGLVNYANRRWCDMGYEQSQVLGQPMADLVAPARREMLQEMFHATLSGQHVDNADLQILRGDGRVGQFSVNLSPMRDDQGNVSSIVAVMSDITDAAIWQAKLMHAEKMAALGQLVSGVAHEVNNPLTAILGFADLLMENPEIPESGRKDLRIILQEAQRTKQIVQNLLSFARQMPPQRKPVQVNPILRRTMQLRSYDFHSRGVEITEQLDAGLPMVVGDSHQLQQVFLNIINNAYDAVRDLDRPARIEIISQQTEHSVDIIFRDNGWGIKNPERIFDPFFTTKEVGEGTGLGLSICYGIVREHGGEILCRNNGDRPGATFIVRLPAATQIESSVGAAAGVTTL